MRPHSAFDSTIDSVTGAVAFVWDFLSGAPRPPGNASTLTSDLSKELAPGQGEILRPEDTSEVIETNGEAL